MANLYTPVSKVIATTGASGAAGYTGMIAAQNSAVASAVTTAQAATGLIAGSIAVTNAQVVVDLDSHIQSIQQTVLYTVNTIS